jgi:hypothetical protein
LKVDQRCRNSARGAFVPRGYGRHNQIPAIGNEALSRFASVQFRRPDVRDGGAAKNVFQVIRSAGDENDRCD